MNWWSLLWVALSSSGAVAFAPCKRTSLSHFDAPSRSLTAAAPRTMLAPPSYSFESSPRSQSSLRITTSLSLPPLRRPSFTTPDHWSAFLQRLRTDEVWQWRAFFYAAFAAVVAGRRAVDRQLARLWAHLMGSTSLAARVFRTDSYEWSLAVACFFVYIHAFQLMDRAIQAASDRGMIHPWRKYRLQDRFEADKLRRRLDKEDGRPELAETDTVVAPDTDATSGNDWNIKVQHSKWNKQAYVFELLVYVLPLLTWDLVAPRRHRRLAPFGVPTTMGILGGIIAGLLLYDGLFFCGHVIMHRFPFIYRTVHAKHHKMSESRACEIVRLSLVEEVLEVGFSIVALNLLSVHPLARSLYNMIITFLLVELHCGFDLPWTPQNVVPFGLATGSRRHHYHHRHGRHYYQKFFFTFDRLFGFFQRDDGSLHGDSVKPNVFVPAPWLTR